jgi:PAS domain S-box-containing protein
MATSRADGAAEAASEDDPHAPAPSDERLQPSQRFLQSALDALAAHIAILDETGRIVAVNAAWRRGADEGRLGLPDAGVGASWFAACDPGEARHGAAAADGIRAVMIGERAEFQLEYATHRDGRRRWFNLRATRFPCDSAMHTLLTHEETTARSAAEELQQARGAVIRLLARATSLESAATELVRAVCERLGWPLGELWIVDERAGRASFAAAWHQPSLDAAAFLRRTGELEVRPGLTLPGLVWAGGRPVWIADIGQAEELPRAAVALAAGLRAAVAVPIQVHGIVGVLAFFLAQPCPPDEEVLALLDDVAGQAALFVERRQAEEALQRSQLELRQVIENAPDGIFIHREGVVAYLNDAFAGALGYRREELVGRRILDLIATDQHEVVRARMSWPANGEPQPPLEVRFFKKSGEAVLLEAVGRPLLSFEGAPARLVMARDLTRQKQMQQRLFLADRMASVGTLAAGVAHEINNPLAYVVANLRFVAEQLAELRGELPPERAGEIASAIADAQEGAERVRVIVRDLRTFSRGDEERQGPVDVQRALDSAIAMAWNEIRHRARLVKDYVPVPLVNGNEARLGQVFLNLLLNAAHAIPEGAAEHNEIRVATDVDAIGRVSVEVRDTGCGIPEEHRDRLFDPFFTTRRVGEGTGLGLSICHGIVHQLGGEIDVHSEVGKGSSFRVLLPVGWSAPVEWPGRPPSAPAGTLRARVLVVDDEQLVLSSVRRLLASEHDVETVAEPRLALGRLLAGERFDVVLCDLMMPELTGMDLHAELARAAPEQAARIVFLTGGAFTPRARTFLDQVPNQRIEKPFDGENLRALVRDRLKKSL